MTAAELVQVAAVEPAAVAEGIAGPLRRGDIQRVRRFEREFWTVARARFGD